MCVIDRLYQLVPSLLRHEESYLDSVQLFDNVAAVVRQGDHCVQHRVIDSKHRTSFVFAVVTHGRQNIRVHLRPSTRAGLFRGEGRRQDGNTERRGASLPIATTAIFSSSGYEVRGGGRCGVICTGLAGLAVGNGLWKPRAKAVRYVDECMGRLFSLREVSCACMQPASFFRGSA